MEARSHQAAHGGLRVTAGHEALADEHRVRAPARVRQQVGGTTHPGLRHPEHVVGQAGGDPPEDRAIDLEGVEVAGVDPDDLGACLQRAVGLLFGMHLDQRRHAERLHAIEKRVERVLLQRGDDQQHQVGPERPRLVHLVRADDEVLAQDRDADGRTHRGEIGQRSPNRRSSVRTLITRAPPSA